MLCVTIEITALIALCHHLPKYKKIHFSCFINKRMRSCVVILYTCKNMFCVVGDKIRRERENMRTCGMCVCVYHYYASQQ